jgi:hypothetical protein
LYIFDTTVGNQYWPLQLTLDARRLGSFYRQDTKSENSQWKVRWHLAITPSKMNSLFLPSGRQALPYSFSWLFSNSLLELTVIFA